jgi:hypothetical protein
MDKFIKQHQRILPEDFCKFALDILSETQTVELNKESSSPSVVYLTEYIEEVLLQRMVEYHKEFPILYAGYNFPSEAELIRNIHFKLGMLQNPSLEYLNPGVSSPWRGMGGSQGVVNFFFFLNDCDGGVDFYHQEDSITAEMGKVVLFPFSFTHTCKLRSSSNEKMYLIWGTIDNLWRNIPAEF